MIDRRSQQLDCFRRVSEDEYKFAKQWKETSGQKIIGLCPMYIPEELVHASGMLPVILQKSKEPLTVAHRHLQPFFCGLARSIADDALNGRLYFLDGVLVADLCLPLKALAGILELNYRINYFKTVHLPMPLKNAVSRKWVNAEFEALRKSLEDFSCSPISETSLAKSISVYNRNKNLLRKLYEFRKRFPALLKATDIVSVVKSSMLMDKEQHTQWMSELLRVLQNMELAENPKDAIRIFLSGSLCEEPDLDVIRMIEDQGAIVIDDDLFVGYRYCANSVSQDLPPIQALSEAYLTMPIPCPTRLDRTKDWGDYVSNSARRNKADGVVILLVKYCEPHQIYYHNMKNKLEKEGLPHLLVEVDHEITSIGHVKTKVDAFVEMLREAKHAGSY